MFWQQFRLLLCWLGETQCCDEIELHRTGTQHQP